MSKLERHGFAEGRSARRQATRSLGLAVAALALAACSGAAAAPSDGDEASTTPTVGPDTAPTSAAVEETVSAASSLTEARHAVVRIEAVGSFYDPADADRYESAGVGSGFIVSEDGLAVTNNHVVGGAGLLRVYVDGDDEPRNARVLGMSECSDLAVIDIDGDGFTWLDWESGDIVAGASVYALGFPLGTDEYTVLDGVISKERADGESSWASVDYVVEHSADALPGNSGGPLVTPDGRVLGVVYAGDDAGQAFAISRETAMPLADRLAGGEDVESLGVNGEAHLGSSASGIWVASVESGSPADRAGIQGGDVITRLEGIQLGLDGTMADYCDVLRSRIPEDVLAVEVYRSETGEVLRGRINDPDGGLEPVTQIDVGAQVGQDGDVTVGYDGYTTVFDDSGLLSVSVPDEWSDVDGTGWYVDGEWFGYAVSASPDLYGFESTWTTPGVFFGVARELAGTDPVELLELRAWYDQCTHLGRDVYSDPFYDGWYDLWGDCGGTSTSFVVIAALPPSGDHMVLVEAQLVDDPDFTALDEILATFIGPDRL